MKIIAILGSPKKNGNTSILAREALRGAKESGAEVEEIFLGDYNIEFCRGCMMCMHDGKCAINDDFEQLKAKVYQSDGIILASPSYGLAPTARFKNFWTDRLGMFTVYTSSLGGKHFLGFSTAGAVGAKKVAKELGFGSTAGIFLTSYCSGYLGVAVGAGDSGMKNIELFPEKITRAYKMGIKLANDIKTNKKYLFQGIGKKILFGFLLKGIMRANLIKNKNGYMKAVYENLKERGLIG
jgi:multimeric flavodoxin WrbA